MGTGTVICAVCTTVVVALALTIGMLAHSLHHIDEGHVGVYFKYGALGDSLGFPGLNTMTPWVSTYEQITVRPLSEKLYTFTAVTKDAIPITIWECQDSICGCISGALYCWWHAKLLAHRYTGATAWVSANTRANA